MKIEKNTYQEVTSNLINIAKLASNEIMKIYKSNFKFTNKKDNSPVTQADKIANKIIVEYLQKEYAGISIISEENKEKKN